MKVALLYVLMFVYCYRGQELRGIVDSVEFFNTCSEVPALDNATPIRPDILNGLPINGGNSTMPCDVVGVSSNITAVTVTLSPSMLASADTLVFSLSNLPQDMQTYEPFRDDLLCSGTRQGQDCQAFGTPMLLGWDTSAVAGVYTTKYDPNYMPFGYAWSECEGLSPQPGEDDLLSWDDPGFSLRHAHVDLPEGFETCQSWAAEVDTLIPTSDGQTPCSYSAITPLNSGIPSEDGSRIVRNAACPANKLQAPLTNEGGTYYTPPVTQNSQCPAVYCPRANSAEYRIGLFREMYPACHALTIENPPKSVMNIVMKTSIVVPKGNGTNEVKPFSTMHMSTIDGNVFVLDTSKTITASLIQFNPGPSIVASSLQGTIVVCGNCNPDEVDTQCKGGIMSDVPRSDPSDPATQSMLARESAFLAVTQNPWRTALLNNELTFTNSSGFYGTEFCTVPMEVCRQLYLKNGTGTGSWMFYNAERTATMFQNKCNGIRLTSQDLINNPQIASLMCLGGMNGTCVPGYEQSSVFVQENAITPCDMQVQFANMLGKSETTPELVNFGFGMPPDFNFVSPQYWLDGTRLYRDAISSRGDGVGVTMVFYLSGDYTGEIHTFAGGKIETANMICSTPAGGSGGSLVVRVVNTGASAGTYTLGAEYFDIFDGQASPAHDVDDLSGLQTFSLEPSQKADVIMQYSYSGSERDEFAARVNLTIPATTAFDPGNRLLDSVGFSCDVTAGLYEGGFYDGTAGDFIGKAILSEDDDDGVCAIWELWCWGDNQADNILRILFYSLVVVDIVFVLILTIRLGRLANAQRHYQRVAKTSTSVMTIFFMVSFVFVGLCSAQVSVLGINSNTQCVNGLNCNRHTTTIRLRVQSTVDASGNAIDTGAFLTDLTVVPTNPEDTQFGSGIECQEKDDGPCTITVPTIVKISMGRPAIQYNLRDDLKFAVPFVYYMNSVGSVTNTQAGGSNAACKDCKCNLALSYPTSQPMSHVPLLDLGHFTRADSNYDHYRCPYTTANSDMPFPDSLPVPELGISTTASSVNNMNYRFACDCTGVTSDCEYANNNDDDNDDSDSTFFSTIAVEFFEQLPMCRVYSIENPGNVVAQVTIDIETAPIGDIPSQSDTVQVQTLQQGMHGNVAISDNKFFQLKILNPVSPTGTYGPDITGYVVQCNDNNPTDDIGRFDMYASTTEGAEDIGSHEEDPFLNPWRTLQDTHRHYSLPIPDVMEPMIANFPTNPGPTYNHTFFYYINASEVASVGRCCGCLGVDPNIYAHPPQVLSGNALRTTPPIEFRYGDLISVAEGGTSKLTSFITCVPNFGLSYRGLDPTTPCEALWDFIQVQDQMREMVDAGNVSGAKSLRVPHIFPQWSNEQPNFWIIGNVLRYEPIINNQIALDAEIILSGDFVSYVSGTKPNGYIGRGSSTFCTASVGDDVIVDGMASYSICNPDDSPSAASYSLDVDCGINTETSPPFSVETRLTTSPSFGVSSGVIEPGRCARTGALGLTPFVISTGLINPALNEGDDTKIVCVYTLYLSPEVTGFDPKQVVVDTYSIGCSVNSGDIGFSPTNTTVINDQNEGDLPTFFVDDKGDDDGVSYMTILFAIIGAGIGAVVLVLLVITCINAKKMETDGKPPTQKQS